MMFPIATACENFSSEFYEVDPNLINSAFDVNETTNFTLTDLLMEKLAWTLNVYYTPVLIILGCLGNVTSITVFYKSKLRLQSTSQYLSALAFSDTLFLCQLLPPWLKTVGASVLFSRAGYCQVFVYLSYVTSNHSSWLVVAFTVERFVAVVYPLRRNAMCTVKRARHIIGSLAAAALLINLPVLRFVVPSGGDCNIDEPLMEHAARFNLLDTVLSFTLPLAAIVLLNAWIMAGVYRVGRTRGHLMRQQRHCRPRAPAPGRAPRPNTCQRSQQRVTRMLLIVSSVYVMLNLPAYSMRILAYANDMSEHAYSGKWAALQQICLMFFNTNFGINFVLYCMSGQNFRRALLETFPWLRRRPLARVPRRDNTTDRPARASSVSISYAQSFSWNHTEATTNYAANNIASGAIVGRVGGEQEGAHQREEGQIGAGDRVAGRAEAAGPIRRRRRRAPQVIQRWRFDNSRQQRRRGSLELTPARVPLGLL